MALTSFFFEDNKEEGLPAQGSENEGDDTRRRRAN